MRPVLGHRKEKAAKKLSAVETERDALKAGLMAQKQEAAEQLAATQTASEAAAAELTEASKQLQTAQADVQRLQGRVSELETSHEQAQGAHEASSKSLATAQVGNLETLASFCLRRRVLPPRLLKSLLAESSWAALLLSYAY